jgi:AbrB family looped-hinge helix DNA binding protein
MAEAANQENKLMSLVRLLRGGQVTLPAETRKALKLNEGDYLEAEVREGSLVLKPVSVVDRQKAWQEVMAIVNEDKWKGPEPRPSPEEEEEQIYEIVREFRERHG